MNRRVGALTTALSLVAVSLTWVAPSSAGAAPISRQAVICSPIDDLLGTCNPPSEAKCKPPPEPTMPGSGLPGTFDGQPDGGNTTNYDKYGYGPHWSTYDLGCAGPASNPGAVIDTFVGNLLYGFATDLVAFGNGIHHLVAPPTFLRVFDKLETAVTQGLYDHLFVVFIPITLLLVALTILFRSRSQDLARALRTVAWAVFVLFLAALVYSGPTRIGRLADDIEIGSVNAVNSALAGPNGSSADPVASLEVDSVLRPAWMQGELGSSTGAVVDRYGQTLWDSQALTWDEAKQADTKAVSDKKRKQFSDTATQVHATYPAAYNQLKGDNGGAGRMGAGGLALGGALVTVPFRIAADAFLLAALILVRVVVMFIPILALVAVHDRMSGLMKGTLTALSAGVMNAVVFAAAGAVNVYGVSIVLGPDSGVPQWFGLVLCLMLMGLLWVATKPFRQLTKMVAGSYHPVNSVAGPVRRVGAYAVEAGVALATGGASLALAATKQGGEDARAGWEGYTPRAETASDEDDDVERPAMPVVDRGRAEGIDDEGTDDEDWGDDGLWPEPMTTSPAVDDGADEAEREKVPA